MALSIALAWLVATVASAAPNSIGMGLPHPTQPSSVASPDGMWRLELDPLQSNGLGACDAVFWHGAQREFSARWPHTPSHVAVSDAGTIALSGFWMSDRFSFQLLAPSGTLLGEQHVELASSADRLFDGPRDLAFNAGLDAFVVSLSTRTRYTFSFALGSGGALALVDARSGALRIPACSLDLPADLKPSSDIERVVPITGTRMTAIEIQTWKPHAAHVLVLDESFALLYELRPEGVGALDLYDYSAHLLESARANEITVRWPKGSDLVRYRLHADGARIVADEVAREPVELIPPTPKLHLDMAAQFPLELPSTFVGKETDGEWPHHGFAHIDARGRILLQDVATTTVYVCDDRGRALTTLSLDEVDPYVSHWVEDVKVTADGGFELLTGNARCLFSQDGKLLRDERATSATRIEFEGGVWFCGLDSLSLMHEDGRREPNLERHGDRRFFTELSGVIRDRDRLIVLDTTQWDRHGVEWGGRLAQFALDGRSLGDCDVRIAPGADQLQLVACVRPWSVLANRWGSSDGGTSSLYLVRADDGSARALEWNEPGRFIGIAPNGKELWRVDVDARKLLRYELP